MAVASDLAQDARVRKTAASAVQFGYQVTVLWGAKGAPAPVYGELSGATTIGVPLPQSPAQADTARCRRLDSGAPVAKAGGASYLAKQWRRVVGKWRALRQARRQPQPAQNLKPVDYRQELPDLVELGELFRPWFEQLAPELIHLHDIHLLAAGVDYRREVRAQGGAVAVVYDSHEYVAGVGYGNQVRTAAVRAMEQACAPEADAVITVSEPIAEAMAAGLGLAQRPAVVLNVPPKAARQAPCATDIRTVTGTPQGAPLVVYSGVLHHRRGIREFIRAMARLPEVYGAIVAVPNAQHPVAVQLAQQIAAADMSERFKVVDPVAPEELVAFISTATAGINPMLGNYPSHELGLPNKIFDYLWAGLPLIGSDLPAQAELVKQWDLGAVANPTSAAELAGAIQQVVDHHAHYATAIVNPEFLDTYCWERQSEVLAQVYAAAWPGDSP